MPIQKIRIMNNYFWLIKYLKYSISAANSFSPHFSPLVMRRNVAARFIPSSISKVGFLLGIGLVWQPLKKIRTKIISNFFIIPILTGTYRCVKGKNADVD